MEPWVIRANNKAIVLCRVATPTSFPTVRVMSEKNIGLE